MTTKLIKKFVTIEIVYDNTDNDVVVPTDEEIEYSILNEADNADLFGDCRYASVAVSSKEI